MNGAENGFFECFYVTSLTPAHLHFWRLDKSKEKSYANVHIPNETSSFCGKKKKTYKNPYLQHKKEASKLDLCGASAEGRGQRLHNGTCLTSAITVEPEHRCGIAVCVDDEA